MKSGTGDDPFADDASNGEGPADSDADPDAATDVETPSDVDETSNAEGASDAENASDDGAPDIPWVLRRSSVKADRPNVTQFFLRDETDRAERRFQSDVEDILDADVYTLDLREAAYLVAMRHPDEVAEELRDWGYEYME